MLAVTETRNEIVNSKQAPPFCCQNGCDNVVIITWKNNYNNKMANIEKKIVRFA